LNSWKKGSKLSNEGNIGAKGALFSFSNSSS
jgi:hypothetical protein